MRPVVVRLIAPSKQILLFLYLTASPSSICFLEDAVTAILHVEVDVVDQ